MFGAKKIDIDGKIMWEDSDGQRSFGQGEHNNDMYGWRKIEVEGKIMWESPEGERSF
jgi:hypothetical protein